jgi:formiminotetrahydrofolate cyclodeaminase/Zn-dependent peptidase ImmA (M78 family)
MSVKLIELPTIELLQKFGAGDHKPGSGSAAALQGMLSAKLLLTVINLTTQEKRKNNYIDWLPDLLKIAEEIDSRIFPALERIFQDDSNQFDKTIKARIARDKEQDIVKLNALSKIALKELQIATEIPIEIANLCIELADFASFVFDHGFRSARGDAGVAQNGAVAAVAGCLSIINLNVLSFDNSLWKESIEAKTNEILTKYNKIREDALLCGEALREEVESRNQFHNDIRAMRNSIEDESKLTIGLLGQIAKNVQNILWKHRSQVWKREVPTNPIDVLSPEKALRCLLGYKYYEENTLGSYQTDTGVFEVAGIIDSNNKTVHISESFQKDTRRFTAAHELGHALLHKEAILHRDRPMDGSGAGNILDIREHQANKFAAFFLLPEKQVKNIFQDIFGQENFVVNEQNVFALTSSSVIPFKNKYKSLRSVTRLIAATQYFSGRSFQSMADIFQVSVETMAIRLEELELVEI